MHCTAFYPRAGTFWGPLLRVDRVLALHVGSEREHPGQAQFACLLAKDDEIQVEDGAPQVKQGSFGPIIDTVIRVLFPPTFRVRAL
jgi:hypothetical protein